MAGIPLRAYTQDIEKQVDSGRTDEAIAHCRYILQSYPRHIATYRLLGKAFLESQRYGDAADIFQRVLSSVPEDFVSHVGMSIIREDEGNLDEAIWHMERAFEVQPSNSAIQDELRRLFGRRDGVEPPKIRLTRGALARMYKKGNLYQQAISEARAVLAENPGRLDLQVLLAELYSDVGQEVKAAETANLVLGKLPNCLVALKILYEVLSNTDRVSEAQALHQRLMYLDPYAEYIDEEHPNPEDIPAHTILIEKLEWTPGEIPIGTPGQPEWATSLGVEIDELASSTQEEALPEWLSGFESETSGETPPPKGVTPDFPQGETSEEEQQTPVEPPEGLQEPLTTDITEDEIPDWMQDAGWMQSDSPPEEAMKGFNLEIEEEVTEEGQEEELAEAEIPEWLRSMAPPSIEAEESPDVKKTDEIQEEDSWIQNLFGEEEPESIPDWVTKKEPVSDQSEDALEEGEMPDIEGADIPEWLKASAAASAVVMGEITSDEPQEMREDDTESLDDALEDQGTIPDWLAEVGGVEVEPVPEEMEAEAIEGIPDWLLEEAESSDESPDTGAEIAAESVSEEDIPDWLEESAGVPGESGSDEAEGLESSTFPEGIPDWLIEDEQGEEELASEIHGEGITDQPFELEEVEDGDITSEPSLVEDEASPKATPAEEIPDWLLEDEGQEEEFTPATSVEREHALPAEEIPDWLLDSEEALPEPTLTDEMMTLGEEESPTPVIEEGPPILGDTQPTRLEAEPEPEVIPPEPKIDEPEEEFEDVDEAFAWLESLAVRQGADEALLLDPEDRLEAPPDWVEKAIRQEDESESLDLASEIYEEEAMKELPDQPPAEFGVEAGAAETGLRGEEEIKIDAEPADIGEVAEPSEAEEIEGGQVVTPGLEAEPTGPPTDQDFPGLESLAEKQGAEEAHLLDEEERLEEPPEWVSKPAQVEPEEEVEGQPEPETARAEIERPETEPEWEDSLLSDIEPEREIQPEVEAELEEEIVIEDEIEMEEDLPDLPEWLEEPTKETGELAWTPPQIVLDVNQASLVDFEKLPQVGFILAQAIVDYRSEYGAFSQIEDLLEVPGFAPEILETIRGQLEIGAPEGPEAYSEPEEPRTISAEADAPPELQEARSALNKGDLEDALGLYSGLIKSGQFLPMIISDLSQASDHFPENLSIWQSLGDAYMRANQIQEALQAYVRAEELLG